MAEARVEVASEARSSVAVAGDILTIEVAENPTTGFRWTPLAADPMLELLGEELERSAGAAPGAGGMRRFRFRVRGAGVVELALRRGWEPENVADRLVVRTRA